MTSNGLLKFITLLLILFIKKSFQTPFIKTDLVEHKKTTKMQLYYDDASMTISKRSRYPQYFFPAMPNGASCFRNLDCASGCCIIDCCFIGKCALQASRGQVCGLLSLNPYGPPSYIFIPNDVKLSVPEERRRRPGRLQYALGKN